ncbi:MAG: alpha/beta fold hydrolase [Chloroflexi bacterium]|nr:alpha/beta fold hydrolase [Chloroflexota bacterium]
MSEMIFFRELGAGPPLLLIHGLLVNGAMFDPILPLLTSHYRVMLPDLCGHGQSGRLPPPYTVQRHVADLVVLLDRLGVEQAAVLGYSQGGTVAQQLAHCHPDRVNRLILVCTYAYNLLTWRERLEGWLMPWLVRLLGLRRLAGVMAGQARELTSQQAAELQEMIAANEKRPSLAAIKALQVFDSRPWLHEISVPTLVIAGEQDNAVPLHHARMLSQAIPNAALRTVPAGHTLIWTHPEQLVALILA